jgi:hypothetical protein
MLFVTLLKARPGSTVQDRVARRLNWQYPEGLKLVAEYWLAGEPTVVTITEADDASVIWNALAQWSDFFEVVAISPAITSEQGIALARERMAAAHA